jgi:hypothetical protein
VYRIYFTYHYYYSKLSFSNESDALEYAKSTSLDFTIYREKIAIGRWNENGYTRLIMDAQRLSEIIREAGYIPNMYSGRGMNCRLCVGVKFDESVFVILSLLMTFCRDMEEVCFLADVFRHAKTESRAGMGEFLYFPTVVWEEE